MKKNRPWLDTTRAANGATVLENFRAWFEDSQVVDDKGVPLTMYHGTTSDFCTFSEDAIGRTFGKDTEGFFFTSRPITAARYADPESAFAAAGMNTHGEPRTGAAIMPVYLSLTNPLTLEGYTEAFYTNPKYEIEDQGISVTDYFDDNTRSIMDMMRSGGHDGVLFAYGDDVLAVALQPSQIKSAIGNSGLYTKDNPSLTDHGEHAGLRLERRAAEQLQAHLVDLTRGFTPTRERVAP